MSTMKTVQGKSKFDKSLNEDSSYVTGTEKLTLQEKQKLLEEMGRADLIEIFKGYQPRQAKRKARRAPLDQRVSITVNDNEKVLLDNELKAIKKSDPSLSMSQYIRNKAIGNIDLVAWAEIAEKAWDELNDIEDHKSELKTQQKSLIVAIDETDDSEELMEYRKELNTVEKKLGLLIAKVEKRPNRMSGRMTMAEAETIKWRAQCLCISTADYLRFRLFDLSPNSVADAHMSLDARRRFYFSIIQLSKKPEGFGQPPEIVECTQCGVYLDTIEKLQEKVRQLETFV